MARPSLLGHPYITVSIAAALLIGLGLLVRSVLQSTVFEQHASIDQFTAISVKGNIYVDSNKNGKKDASEQNYTGKPQAQVWLALFENKCGGPTPSIKPSTTPIPPTGAVTPTPPPGCYYQKLCPAGLLCRGGNQPWCPPCKAQLVCPEKCQKTDNGQIVCPPSNPPSATGTVVPGQPVSATPAVKGATDVAQAPGTVTQEDQDKRTAQGDDVCKRLPVRVIHCPVAADGTYLCTAEGVTFSDAWVKAMEPARYVITSTNPVAVKAPADTVDFGVYPFFQPVFQGGAGSGVKAGLLK